MSIFVVLALALFLLGFVGFAVDMTNLYFHRQMAQGAADAACQAGIMDVLLIAQGNPVPGAGFTPGTGFDCASSSGAVPCRYAALNGYNGTGLVSGTPSNQVQVSFPGSVPGVTPPPSSLAPIPFLRVDIIDRVRLTFASLITRQPTSDVRAIAECALVQAKAPIPIIVLNPVCSHAFVVSGSGSVKIIGGPNKSVQVNSRSTWPPGPANCSAATVPTGCGTTTTPCSGSNCAVDLSQAGPNFTGSVFGTFGGASPMATGFNPGSTGAWISPASPISDPFAMTPAPPDPCPGQASCVTTPIQGYAVIPGCSATTSPCGPVPYGVNGCPDNMGCTEYAPGKYNAPIYVKQETAIFDPGIYYIAPTAYTATAPNFGRSANYCGKPACTDIAQPTGSNCRADFAVESNGIVRPSTAPGDGSLGTIFYLTHASGISEYGSVFFGANAGKPGGRIVDAYVPAGSVTSPPIVCPGGAPPNPPLPSTLVGNVLLAPCSGPYGDPLGVSRRMLLFQDRANGNSYSQPTLQGGGGLLLAGTMYFHNCPASPVCQPYNTDYNAFLQFQGNPGSDTRVIGNIITDQLNLAGNGSVNMVLDPNAIYNILKATLVR